MSKGGYGKLLIKLQESKAEILDLRSQIMERDQKAARVRVASRREQEVKSVYAAEKAKEFWTSTPLWSGITMLLGLLLSRVSVILAYFIAWCLMVFEFVRIVSFTVALKRALWSIGFAIFIAGVLFALWKITPQPQEIPSLDRTANNAANEALDNLVKRFPWLSTKPKEDMEANRLLSRASAQPRPWVALDMDPESINLENSRGFSLSVSDNEKNTGTSVAKRVSMVGDLFIGPRGLAAENRVFELLGQRPILPWYDQPPGNAKLVSFGGPIPVPIDPNINSGDESVRLVSGLDVMYLAVRVTYRDEKGGVHHTEQCLVGENLHDSMSFCTTHNIAD